MNKTTATITMITRNDGVQEGVKEIPGTNDFRTVYGERFSNSAQLQEIRASFTPAWAKGEKPTFIYTHRERYEEARIGRDGSVRTQFGEAFDSIQDYEDHRRIALPCEAWASGEGKKFVYEVTLFDGTTEEVLINKDGSITDNARKNYESIYTFRRTRRAQKVAPKKERAKNTTPMIKVDVEAHNAAEDAHKEGPDVEIKAGGHVYINGEHRRGIVKNAGDILAAVWK